MLKRFKKNKKLIIEPYRGYASSRKLYIRGRILAHKKIVVEQQENFINTFMDNFKRFDSNEIPNVPLTLNFHSKSYEIKSDREGFFLLNEDHGPPLGDIARWEHIDIKTSNLTTHKWTNQHARTQGEILIPSANAQYGVISDIDDTILKTNVSVMAKAIHNTLFKNPYDRHQLMGMSTWIQGFQQSKNPIFYVSKSPRNIFNYLSQFLIINQFPKGPILLRDFGRQGTIRAKDSPGHKKEEIVRILLAYPHLKFILIGDIAGDDPMIYHEVQSEFQNSILAIYIRDIKHRRKQKKFSKWLDNRSFPNLFVMKNAWEGAHHAHDQGWISNGTLQKMKTEFFES